VEKTLVERGMCERGRGGLSRQVRRHLRLGSPAAYRLLRAAAQSKLYETKVLLLVDPARSRKLSYDDRRNDKFVMLLGCVFYQLSTYAFRKVEC
jgi:hypothetical protein